MFYSLITLMQKVASSIAIPLILLLLDATGYIAEFNPTASQRTVGYPPGGGTDSGRPAVDRDPFCLALPAQPERARVDCRWFGRSPRRKRKAAP